RIRHALQTTHRNRRSGHGPGRGIMSMGTFPRFNSRSPFIVRMGSVPCLKRRDAPRPPAPRRPTTTRIEDSSMRELFHADLKSLGVQLEEIAGLVREAMTKAQTSFQEADVE